MGEEREIRERRRTKKGERDKEERKIEPEGEI